MTIRHLASIALVASVAVLGPSSAAASPHPSHAVAVRSFDQKLLDKVNADRKRHHLDAYTFSPTLWKIAHSWAKHLASAGALSHRGNLTTLVHQRCGAHANAGENVAFISGSHHQLSSMFDEYVSDKPHRENVLSSSFTVIGIASIKQKAGGKTQEWSVMDLATRC